MRQRRGFTTVELLIVLLILGILAVIAIPLSSSRSRAQDTAARADLRSAVTTALTIRTTSTVWPDATALAAAESSLRTVTGHATRGTISVSVADGTFRAATLSASGTCPLVIAAANGTVTWTQKTGACVAAP
jgi:prepilin-type N-terminal cleavage/methylation domain-containing protein